MLGTGQLFDALTLSRSLQFNLTGEAVTTKQGEPEARASGLVPPVGSRHRSPHSTSVPADSVSRIQHSSRKWWPGRLSEMRMVIALKALTSFRTASNFTIPCSLPGQLVQEFRGSNGFLNVVSTNSFILPRS